MVNRRISADIKDCVLRLWAAGWNEEDVLSALSVSRASLYRWKTYFDTFGTVNKLPSPLKGRTRIITRAVLTAVYQIYETHSDIYLDELVWWLAINHDIVISRSALQQNLQEAGLTRKLLRKLALERDAALRLEWKEFILEHGEGQAQEFVVVDETSKNDHSTARHWGRAISGERAELMDVFVRGDRYSLVAAMTVDGYIAAQAVPGSFDSMTFYDFIAEEVLPQMNPWPEERSILVLDNCRIHHNNLLVDLIHNAGCIIAYLPPYSPDLTPIEESFSCLKAYIRRNGWVIRNENDAIEALLEACGCITAEKAFQWFKHAGYIVE